MEIETSGAIRLFFPNPSLALVYFEALANAIDAGATEVSIHIDIDSFDRPESLSITVTDNGEGFTDESFERFSTLLKPRDQYHKGVGRLVFLNYFRLVEVSSTFGENRREFSVQEGFTGKAPVQILAEEHANQTKLRFTRFNKQRVKSYDDLRPEALKPEVIKHFLPTLSALSRKSTPFSIALRLTTREGNNQREFFPHDTTITAADIPVLEKKTVSDPCLDLLDPVEMYYLVKSKPGKHEPLIAFSIDGRTVPAKLIQPASIPLSYFCVFLFESKIFYASADTSRQKLVLKEGINEASFLGALRREVGRVLNDEIPQISEKNTSTQQKFENKFPHLLGLFESDTIGLIDHDEALTNAQLRFFHTQKEVLQSESLSDTVYKKSLELSSRTLMEYILYRDKIIKKMRSMSMDNSEDEIHNLIVPRRQEFVQADLPSAAYQNNAWLLDDKFMVFQTILSEQRMDRIIDAIRLDGEGPTDRGRPDIAMIFSNDPNVGQGVDVVVVEIKKKTNDEKENQYAITQLLSRAEKLAAFCPNVQRIWYYAVLEIGEAMGTRLWQQKWAPLYSRGKVYYQDYQTARPDGTIVPTPTFVMSFEAIVADAECRNHTFLEIMRDSMKRFSSINDTASEQCPSAAVDAVPEP